jgi:hypothetical protein
VEGGVSDLHLLVIIANGIIVRNGTAKNKKDVAYDAKQYLDELKKVL